MRRTGENGRRRTLVIAEIGLLAIGIVSDEVPSTRAIATKLPPKQRSRRAERTPTVAQATTNKPPPAVRQGTKQALPIDLLKRTCGATIAEAIRRRGNSRVWPNRGKVQACVMPYDFCP
jgi:hypothetical protein